MLGLGPLHEDCTRTLTKLVDTPPRASGDWSIARRPSGTNLEAVNFPMTTPKKKAAKNSAALLRESPGPPVGSLGEVDVPALVGDLGAMIDAAREQVAITADATLATLYWQTGHRVRTEVLDGRRADYGARVIAAAGKQLGTRYGRGFGEANLRRMVRSSSVFTDAKIVAALLRELAWTHFTILIPIKDALKREFYTEMCRVEHWSTRDLRERIDVFSRQASTTNLA